MSWLPLRSKTNKEGKEKHQGGIVPFNMLWDKSRAESFGSLLISLGMGATNLLPDKSKTESWVRVNNDDGSSPSKLQPARNSLLRDFKRAMESGMFPEKAI